MKIDLTFNFDQSVEDVFEHMIHFKDFEKWKQTEGIFNIVELVEQDQYIGFWTDYDISGRTAKTVCESVLYVKNKEVRYRVVSSTFEDGTDVYSGWTFPFVQMYQRFCFSENSGRCRVNHEIIFKPKNLLGWITCRIFIKPQVISDVKQSNRALADYLASL